MLVLHGGGARRDRMMVSPTQLSVLRMVPVARRLARVSPDLAVFRLLNSHRGWDSRRTPLHDVAWALGEVRHGAARDLPVALVGHSLGGRAALLSGDRPGVACVVALNAYLRPPDGGLDLGGRPVLFVHGTQDRIATPGQALAAADRAVRTGTVGFILVEGARHGMLRRHRRFDDAAAHFVGTTLLGLPPEGAVARVLAGEPLVRV